MKDALSRREALRLSAMAAGGAALGLPAIAHAQDQAPIGTWPAGVSGNTVFVGIQRPAHRHLRGARRG